MNILFGLAIVLVLMLGEISSSNQIIASDETRVALLILLTSIPPLFAAAQVCLFHYRFSAASDFDSKRGALARFAMWHFAVWLLSSIAIVVVIQWQLTVRSSWNLDRFPAIDEMLILAPSLVSLILSWFILFETQSTSIEDLEVGSARQEYVALRCRVYLMMVLIPILLMILVKDFWYLIERLPLYVLLAATFSCLIGLLAIMPILVGKLWASRSVSPDEGRQRMLQISNNHHMQIKDILVWDTGQSMVNALVTGVFPRYRVLMVSDLLLSSFPAEEVDSILRHEAGHLRLSHLPVRLAFILLPALAMVSMDLDSNQTFLSSTESLVAQIGLPIAPALIPPGLFVVYLLVVTAWLSRMMEYEADLYAAGLLPQNDHENDNIVANSTRSMTRALCRFGEGSAKQMNESTLTHPSLQNRLDLVKKCSSNPSLAAAFQRRFRLQQVALAGLILILTSLMFIW